ncbi:MAG: molybdopterin converting factor subunit 1 [Alphaproteobacteria bacterium]|nr:molybdopterin converting factor subunit 1 [Alphaproteobacteria bacterium]
MTLGPDTSRNAPNGTEANRVTLRYFAWVREKVGHAEEEVSLPPEIATIADLVDWLRRRGDTYASAFARPEVVRAAIDQTHVRTDAALHGAREIAFFPPVTGG